MNNDFKMSNMQEKHNNIVNSSERMMCFDFLQREVETMKKAFYLQQQLVCPYNNSYNYIKASLSNSEKKK